MAYHLYLHSCRKLIKSLLQINIFYSVQPLLQNQENRCNYSESDSFLYGDFVIDMKRQK